VTQEPQPSSDKIDCPPQWRAKPSWSFRTLFQKIVTWFGEQSTLIDAFWVAVTFHILLFPLIWFAGWALPWPRSPVITTVVELNLENWPREARAGRVQELYNYYWSQAHKTSK
jgi:hypothetical protein